MDVYSKLKNPCLSAIVAAALIGTGLPVTAKPLLRPGDSVYVKRGAVVYKEHCASCHGAKLEGQPNWRTRKPDGRLPAPPHDQTGHTWHHPDDLLFDMTKHGTEKLVGGGYKSDMPGYADRLSDADIIAVLSYIKSKWPAGIRARHDRINARLR